MNRPLRITARGRVTAILFSLLLAVSVVQAEAVEQVSVNVAKRLHDMDARRKIGINLNYWLDAEGGRPEGSRPLAESLREMGVAMLRYPGGQKSDYYAWSTEPFDRPNPRLSRFGRKEWPSSDPRVWSPAGDPNGKWVRPVMDFDEFMALAKAVGAEPNLVVNQKNLRVPAAAGGIAMNQEQGLAMACAWVRYANQVKGYNVKYWSIANEPWLKRADGAKMSPAEYGQDAARFAKAMKAVDPTIKIGLSGEKKPWFMESLRHCADDIDFLDVHGYPLYVLSKNEKGSSYDEYVKLDLNIGTQYVEQVQAAIDAQSPANRSRLFIAFTETSALSYGLWDRKADGCGADTGHGLATFEILAQLAADRRVRFAEFWCTRYWGGNSAVCSALDETNGLNAQGLAIKVLVQNLYEHMVETTQTALVRTFASYRPSSRALSVLLVNKSRTASSTQVLLRNVAASSTAERWVYKGSSEKDIAPTFTRDGTVNVDADSMQLTLDPVSITVLKVSAGAK